jgi:hypothetical protein
MLLYELVETTSVADIADYLCRDVDEVERPEGRKE